MPVAVLRLLTIVVLLIQAACRKSVPQQTLSFFVITNSSMALAITKNSDGRLFCQLFENGHSISELHSLSSVVPFRHYNSITDEKTTCVSNTATVSWLAEDGYDGDLYRVTIDINNQRLIAGSNVWSVGNSTVK